MRTDESLRSSPAAHLTVALLLLLIVRTAGASPTAAPSSGMSLWEEAVAVAGRNADYVPASVYTKVTITDGKGDLKSVQETWSHVGVGRGGKLETEVLRSVKDGRDNTENARKELARHPNRSRFDYSALPMMPANRDRAEVHPTGKSRAVDGVRCAGYSFRMTNKKHQAMTGTVWIDESDGAPLLLDFSFAPLPTGAQVVTNSLHFVVTPGGRWQLASLETHAEGQFLFLHRVLRLRMEFSDYFEFLPSGRVSGTSH